MEKKEDSKIFNSNGGHVFPKFTPKLQNAPLNCIASFQKNMQLTIRINWAFIIEFSKLSLIQLDMAILFELGNKSP